MPKLDMDDFDDRQHDDEEPDEAARRIVKTQLDKLEDRARLLRRSLKSQNRKLEPRDREEIRDWLTRKHQLTFDLLQDDKSDDSGFSFTADYD